VTPRELIDIAPVPGGQELKLYRRGADHMIVLDRNELMSSRMSGSEKALAVMTLERLKSRKDPHLLIGGYGMGFTLRAALAGLGQGGRVTLVELVPKIIEFAHAKGMRVSGHVPAFMNAEQFVRAGVDEFEQFFCHFTGEVAGAGGELDDDVVHGAEVVDRFGRCIGHVASVRSVDGCNLACSVGDHESPHVG